jgi:hypothetical protein
MRLCPIDDSRGESEVDRFGASADCSEGGGGVRPLALMHVPAGKRLIIESATVAEVALNTPSRTAVHRAFKGCAHTPCNAQLRVVSGAVQGVGE